MNRILQGDCLQVLPTLPANTFDSLVTDPPASIRFMGQRWDGDRGGRRQWVSWLSQVMREALRVLKPGAHGLVWAIPRRSHWTALALEDAGFEIRDCIHHYFLTSFNRFISVDKAIDKSLGVKRTVIRIDPCPDIKGVNGYAPGRDYTKFDYEYTAATSPQAQQWEGWGTKLNAAIEHWWLVRKPTSEKTIAANVLKWGTGALNLAAARLPRPNRQGYPSHFVVSDPELLGDHSPFFHPPIYSPKANRKEKERGCDGLPLRTPEEITGRKSGSKGLNDSRAVIQSARRNDHPTVKPVELMKYFVTLLTRPGGSVLDCLAGSFTTGVAAKELGLDFTGIEIDTSYVQIGLRRLSA